MQKIIIYFVALVALAGAAYFVWSRAPRIPEIDMATSTPQAIQLETKKVSEESAEYKIEGEYPQFGSSAIDAAVKTKVDAAMSAFKEYPVNPPEFGLPKNEQGISYGDVYIGDDFVSLTLSIYEYTGGAHPNTTIVSVSVDRKTGKEVTLDQALSLIGRSLSQVASESLAKLTAKLGADVVFEEGAVAKAENYSTFVIDKDSVTFIFNNYQVAPYAAGQQEVEFARQ